MSRWLWLVKWFLAIPHYIVLAFLWVAFVVVSVIAFFAILFTGRYPEALFDFNVGVLRWSWRVSYYTYGALGTDRYPPFTLDDVPDYPAHFDVDRPAHLSRGLVLVKSWLLAIPHYLVIGIFLGGGTWAVSRAADTTAGGPGLIGLLVFVAAVVLLFTGRYPQQIFDFVLGMNRWVLRVAAYAGLMTDSYPPFRLDLGGHETAGTMTLAAPAETAFPGPAGTPVAVEPPTPPARRGWTGGRITSVVIGSLLALAALGLVGAGAVTAWATSTQRDAAGYVSTDRATFATSGYAVTSDQIDLGGATGWVTPGDLLGTVRIRVTATDPGRAVFVGVAPQSQADAYLFGSGRLTVSVWGDHTSNSIPAGTAPRIPPAALRIWTASTSGTGPQTLTWRPSSGQWAIVVMNADARPGVSVTADVGATVPDLAWFATGLFALGAVLLTGAAVLIAVPVTRAGR